MASVITPVSSTHLAAVAVAKGQEFELQVRPTPKPGPGELLIAVKSVALNPADGHMQRRGLFISRYPTVVGFDMSGIVLEVGGDVPTGARGSDPDLSFQPGTRIAAYAACAWRSCEPDYGPFQERCLVPWQQCVPLPNENLSWNEAATLPVAVQVPLSAWDALGIPRALVAKDAGVSGGNEALQHEEKKREALLIWGASASVGTMGVQGARLIRDNRDSGIAAVYATAGLANGEYVKTLGADRVFDYKDPQVVSAIVSAAREDGLTIRHCFLATGELGPCQEVLQAFLAKDTEKREKAKIASAPIVPADADIVDGLETIFLMPSQNEGERLEQFRYWMGMWLRERLAEGVIRPSPEPEVLDGGLKAINAGLDRVLRGVSCTKLVIEVN
ncbi:GroES-like protein [Xylariomycetidae sp. FL2044]|nr:GroES-like protein [Xylariomycetidae sp. FL2044]